MIGAYCRQIFTTAKAAAGKGPGSICPLKGLGLVALAANAVASI
jgi:NAD/NADP transhydrogenase alpha subunit